MRALGRFVIVLAGATTALLAIGTAVFAAGSSNEVLGATETVNGVRYSSAWVDFSGSQNNEATLADLAPDGHHAHMDLYFYDPRLETTVTLKLDNYNGYNSYNVVKTYGSTIPPGATVHFRACAQEGSSPVILCSSYVTAVAG